MAKTMREILEECGLTCAMIGRGINCNKTYGELIDSALTQIKQVITDAIEQCLVYNDSDTHIIAKDLIEELEFKMEGDDDEPISK